MKSVKILAIAIASVMLLGMGATLASAQMLPNPYGAPIGVEDARKAAAAALAEARRNKWNMAVAVVDPSGNLVYYEKMDNTQLGSAEFSIDKARSAALFKRPTRSFQDALAQGGQNLRTLKVRDAVPVEGGIPLIADGKIVGAIGVSGDTADNDGKCARAGADVIK